jgi:hypothetical protein
MLRTVLAALIIVSIALLPAAGSATVPSSAVEMSGSTDMPCCPCCDTPDNTISAACVAKCIGFFGVLVPPAIPLSFFLRNAGLPAEGVALHARSIQPPTHPPPV